MKILVGIPVLYGADHCKNAIDSVINQSDLIIIDNGSDKDVKDLIHSYNSPNAWCIRNEKNVYVNKAWNQIIEYFLKGDWDYLVIMNSDLTLEKKWSEVCRNRWKVNPDEILIPKMVSEVPRGTETYVMDAQTVTEGTAGVFITLNRKQAEIVYPIPENIKVWFGDNWIFSILRSLGYETVIPENLFSCHGWSQTISKVPNISDIIEDDKVAWNTIVEPQMRELIDKHKCLTT